MGEKEKQTPGKRYQLQMFLQNILEVDTEEFVLIGEELLNSNNVRYYMKFVFYELMGQIQKPDENIIEFFLENCDNVIWGKYLINNVALSRKQYVGILMENPDNGDVLICDNDNVSFDNSKPGGVLGTPGFMAPEIVRGEKRPSKDTDRYSLSVLLFYLFMVNHPLEGKLEASIRCMDMVARVKLYGTDPVFIFDPNNKTNRPVKGIHDNATIYWPLYPEKLRQMFTRAFTVGLNEPSKRITEPEWMTLFSNMMSGMLQGRSSFGIKTCSNRKLGIYRIEIY